MELIGGLVKFGIEYFFLFMDYFEDFVEIIEYEIDYRDYFQVQFFQDFFFEIKYVIKFYEKLFLVVKLEILDLLIIEVFGDDVFFFKKDIFQDSSNKMLDILIICFNFFLKDDLEIDFVFCLVDFYCDNFFNKYFFEVFDKLIFRGSFNVVSQLIKISSLLYNLSLSIVSVVSQLIKDGSLLFDLVISIVILTEERLLFVVGDDDIVFNFKIKRYKKKKKGIV